MGFTVCGDGLPDEEPGSADAVLVADEEPPRARVGRTTAWLPRSGPASPPEILSAEALGLEPETAADYATWALWAWRMVCCAAWDAISPR